MVNKRFGYKYTLKLGGSPYGFGRNWHFVIWKNGKKKEFFLGQDAKVLSRVLGVKASYYTNKHGKDFDKSKDHIARDLLKNWCSGNITKKKMDAVWNNQPWGFAVE